jgi:hypothetical protein
MLPNGALLIALPGISNASLRPKEKAISAPDYISVEPAMVGLRLGKDQHDLR